MKTAKQGVLITYGNLANALDLSPPHRIHQLTEALEFLMEEDAAARRPFIAALAISKRRGGLPAPGFFDCARRLGRYTGKDHDSSASAYHAWESNAARAFWTDSGYGVALPLFIIVFMISEGEKWWVAVRVAAGVWSFVFFILVEIVYVNLPRSYLEDFVGW